MSSLSMKFIGDKCGNKAQSFIAKRRLLGEHWELGVSCGSLVIVVRRRKLEK